MYSTPSKYLECKFSRISDEFLILRPICPNTDFRYKALNHQYQILTLRLQIGYCGDFKVNLKRVQFWDYF